MCVASVWRNPRILGEKSQKIILAQFENLHQVFWGLFCGLAKKTKFLQSQAFFFEEKGSETAAQKNKDRSLSQNVK